MILRNVNGMKSKKKDNQSEQQPLLLNKPAIGKRI